MLLTRLLPIALVYFVCFDRCVWRGDAAKTPLYIGGLLPLADRDGWDRIIGYTALVGARQAILDINNRSDVLKDYELVLEVADTEGTIPAALNSVYEMLYNPPVKIAIYGPMFSFTTEVVAEVTGLWNLVEMSPFSSTPVLNDRERFPYFYRIITSAAGFSSAHIHLFGLFGWHKIATLHQAKEPHIGSINELQNLIAVSDFSIVSAESFLTDPYIALSRLKLKDIRIIVTSFAQGMLWKMFCSIYRLDMYGEEYVWIIPGNFPDQWWTIEYGEECTKSQLRRASEGYLSIAFTYHGITDEVGISGKTPQQFRDEIADEVGYENAATDTDLSAHGYDSIWALALALNETEVILDRRLDTYRYGDHEFARTFGDRILGLQFAGPSGPVSFSQGGDRIGKLLIEQNVDGKEKVVAVYDKLTDEIEWKIPSAELWYYSGGKPPFDSDVTITIDILQGTPSALVAAMGVFSGVGTIIAVLFVVFNIWKRKHRQIKMSSPKVNNIIAFGIMLAYLCVVLLGIDRTMVKERTLLTICRVRSWIIPLAFTLAFGGMFTKMWRVYSIVIANKTKRKVIKDYYLFGIIALLLFIDFAILIPWQIFDPINIKKNRVQIIQTKEDIANDERRVFLYVICLSHNNTIWTMAMIIYKAFVVVFGVFLAWSTRNIKVSGLNDSYYVGLSIYNTVICCVVAVPLSILNVSSAVVTFALVSAFLLLCITASLCMLFIPKIVAVYRNNDIANETFTGLRIGVTAGAVASTDGSRGPDVPTTSALVESRTASHH